MLEGELHEALREMNRWGIHEDSVLKGSHCLQFNDYTVGAVECHASGIGVGDRGRGNDLL